MKLYTEQQLREAIAMGYDWCHQKHIPSDDMINNFIESLTPIELPSDEELAILFHNKYEELAPEFKYETRMETKKFTKDSDNGKLMIAVCKEILQYLTKNK